MKNYSNIYILLVFLLLSCSEKAIDEYSDKEIKIAYYDPSEHTVFVRTLDNNLLNSCPVENLTTINVKWDWMGERIALAQLGQGDSYITILSDTVVLRSFKFNSYPSSMHVFQWDHSNQFLYVVMSSGQNLIKIDIETGQKETIFSKNDIESRFPNLNSPESLIIDKNGETVYFSVLTDEYRNLRTIYSYNLLTAKLDKVLNLNFPSGRWGIEPDKYFVYESNFNGVYDIVAYDFLNNDSTRYSLRNTIQRLVFPKTTNSAMLFTLFMYDRKADYYEIWICDAGSDNTVPGEIFIFPEDF